MNKKPSQVKKKFGNTDDGVKGQVYDKQKNTTYLNTIGFAPVAVLYGTVHAAPSYPIEFQAVKGPLFQHRRQWRWWWKQ
jgi:hypothetical protein